ncbi:MAG TPA: tyrosine-type recombinase/integrase [Bacteroidia bacterium]|nr:tyrosine-type recombinase/integrase [Bacteroidia bacterium]
MNEHPFNSFIDFIRNEKRYSPHTALAYESDLIQFRDFLVETYGDMAPAEAGYQVIRSWIARLMDQGMDPRSVNRKITSLRGYYRFLRVSGEITSNPTHRIQGPKISKRLPAFVEERNIDNLLDSNILKESPGDEYSRMLDRLIIEMLYATGIRVSELVNLAGNNINYSKSTIKVLGKRNRERIIPVPDELLELITVFRRFRDNELAKNGLSAGSELLVDSRGKKLSRGFVYKKVRYYLSLVTTIEKKSPHVLRHTFATHMLNNGADLNAIREILGHTSLAATQVYTHNTVEKLKAVYHKAHPRA